MACFRPLKAYRAPGGGVAFDSKRGFVDRPLELACGQCIGCRVERSRQWASRCVHEALMHERNSFITLTYDQANMPADGSLDVSDWQKFAKRLRKKIGRFRFFHCGEYGDRTKRPHYHACMFGVDFSEDRELFRKTKYGNLFVSKLLQDTWSKGFCTVGSLTYESAAYVSRYVIKKKTGPEGQKEYSDVGLKPPYITMSRRPGIGSTWFDKYVDDVFPRDEVVHGGRRFRPPRFYDDRYADLDGPSMEELKKRRRDAVSKRKMELTPERLRTRERVAEATADYFEREA